jgi:hypothetical protein
MSRDGRRDGALRVGGAVLAAAVAALASRDARADPAAATAGAPVPAPPVTPEPTDARPVEPLPLDARAENVSFDARAKELDLDGDVRLDESPFYLRSDHLRLRRVPLGLDVDGTGKLIFCPCLGAPLAVGFSGGLVAPPGDVVLRSPRLLIFGLPVFWLPAIWLRSPARTGVLPPDIAWRGTDGLFLGEGLHLPFRSDDGERGLDLRGGGYVQGGAAVEAKLVDGTGTTRIAWDHLRGDGLVVDIRGAVPAAGASGAGPGTGESGAGPGTGESGAGPGTGESGAGPGTGDRSGLPSVAWDVDALRGARGLRATSDLDAVSRPVDRGRASAAWRLGSDHSGGAGPYGQWTVAIDERASAIRGGDLAELGMQGPEATLRTGGGVARGRSALTYDAKLSGGAFSGTYVPTTSFARLDAGLLAATQVAPFGLEVRARGAGNGANDGQSSGLARSGSVRGVASLPLSRAFAHGGQDANDPYVHRTEPRLVVGAVSTGGDPVLGTLPGRGFAGIARGSSWVTSFEWANAFGRWGARQGVEAVLAAGAVGGVDGPRPVGRARASVDTRYLALSVDAAGLLAASGATSESAALSAATHPITGTGTTVGVLGPTGAGAALYSRARLGAIDSVNLGATLAGRSGVDPVAARALFDAPLDPSTGFVASTGWTLATRATIPLGPHVAPSGGADIDLASGTLVGARGGLELRDRCGCLVVRATAAHRIGRPGVDAGITIDLAPH